jgi:endonuclease YncB( thermonuclease family)
MVSPFSEVPMHRFAALAALLFLTFPLAAEPIASARIQVVDGDTVRVNGETYRLVGFDAPEVWRARCPRERDIGRRATLRLRKLVSSGRLDLQRVACSCPRRTPAGSEACNHGRRCGTLRANRRDVGHVLVKEGFAKPYAYSWQRPPRKPEWCHVKRGGS